MREPGATPVADALVDFVLGLEEPESLPDAVTEAAGLCLTDWVGVAIRGSTEPLAGALDAVIAAAGGGSRRRRSSGEAAGRARCWPRSPTAPRATRSTSTSTHLASIVHGSAPVAPVALAIAERRGGRAPRDLKAFAAASRSRRGSGG